jgi:hypothetical protein
LPRPFPFAKVFDHRQEGDGVAYGIDWRMLQAQGGDAQTFGASMVVNSINIAYRVAHANMYVLLLLLLLHIFDTLPCVCLISEQVFRRVRVCSRRQTCSCCRVQHGLIGCSVQGFVSSVASAWEHDWVDAGNEAWSGTSRHSGQSWQ